MSGRGAYEREGEKGKPSWRRRSAIGTLARRYGCRYSHPARFLTIHNEKSECRQLCTAVGGASLKAARFPEA